MNQSCFIPKGMSFILDTFVIIALIISIIDSHSDSYELPKKLIANGRYGNQGLFH